MTSEEQPPVARETTVVVYEEKRQEAGKHVSSIQSQISSIAPLRDEPTEDTTHAEVSSAAHYMSNGTLGTADIVITAVNVTKQIFPQSCKTTTTGKASLPVHLRHHEERHSDDSSICSKETVLYSKTPYLISIVHLKAISAKN
jgi:hypothetical protein